MKSMKEILKTHLLEVANLDTDEDWVTWHYSEDINPDALTDAWLENRTSYIYKVCVLAAIDANKCDWVHVAIGAQRSENSTPQIIGVFYFPEGENDDMGRTIKRIANLLSGIHPAFEDAV